MLLRYTLLNLWRHPFRTLATTLGVALGIAAVLSTVTVGDNINANLDKVFNQSSGKAALVLAPSGNTRGFIRQSDAERLAKTLPKVIDVLPTLEYFAVEQKKANTYTRALIPGLENGFMLSGQDTTQPENVAARLAEGALPVPQRYQIAITQAYALKENYKIGDQIALLAPLGTLKFTISGLLKADAGLSNLNGGKVGIVALPDLQKAVFLRNQVSYLGLVLQAGTNSETLRASIDPKLPPELSILHPAGRNQISNGLVQTVQSGLQVLAVTMLALSGFLAYNTFAAAVVERQREFALLRILGFTRRHIVGMAYLEALVVSVLGIVMGIALGVVMAAGLTALNAFLLQFPFQTLVLPWDKIVLASAVGTVVAFVAATGPARSAAAVSPMAATRQVFQEHGQPPVLWGVLLMVAGIIMALLKWPSAIAMLGASLSMGSIFLGIALVAPTLITPASRLLMPAITAVFGTAGRLGLSTAQRSQARNGVAVGAVALGLGLIIGVGGMVSGINKNLSDWVNNTILGDMFMAAAAPFPANFDQTLRQKYPELTEINPIAVRVVRFRPPQGRARNASMVLPKPDRYDAKTGSGKLQFLEGDIHTSLPLFRKGGVYISGTISDRYRLHIGDQVELRTVKGWKKFPIIGVVVDYTSAGETFVAPLDQLDLFGGGQPELYVLSVQKGLDARAIGAKMKQDYAKLYLDLQYNADYRAMILKVTSQFFGSTNSLLVLTMLIAALGVANTLGMNLSERLHEMAVLRALGLTRKELMYSIFAEGVLVVVLGTLLGLMAGMLLSGVITQGANSMTGYRIAPSYPWPLFVWAVLASPVVGVLAAFIPARRAATTSPANALRQTE